MPGLIILAITGGLVCFVSLMTSIAISAQAKSAIHEIYAAVAGLTSAIGLLTATVAIGAAVVLTAIRNADRDASHGRRGIAEAVRLLAEHRRVG